MIVDKDGYGQLGQDTNRRFERKVKDLTITPYLEEFEGKRSTAPRHFTHNARPGSSNRVQFAESI